jgi:outer membrane receptor protein involved in Fe transport
MLRTILYFNFVFCAFNVFAQPGNPTQGEGIVSGKVIDKNTELTIEYVSFKLFSVKDSALVAGIFSDNEGKFTLEQLPFGTYYGKLTFSGYLTKVIPDIKVSSSLKVANLGTIKLDLEKTGDLKEIKVTGQLDVLKAGIDKKVYNVGEDLSVKGGTANDVLLKIPSVELDQDGKVSLRGEGSVTILIDGRPSSLSGGNGKTLLDALPAGSIERIEVVNNPSAKYDPDGTSGIINIVLKKNKLKGFNGLISANAGSGDLSGGNVFDGTVSLSYMNAKVNVYGSYTGRYLEGYRNNYSDLHQSFSDGSAIRIQQDRIGTDLNAGNTFRFGTDFFLKPRHFLGVSATGSMGVRNRTGGQWNYKYDHSGSDTLLSEWWRYADDPSQQRNLDLNLNYKFDLKNDRGNLVVDANQSFGEDNIQGYYTQYYTYDPVISLLDTTKQQLSNKETNNITTIQADLTYLYPEINARMETGMKMIRRDQGVDTYSEAYDQLTGAYFKDTLANFLYAYNEQVYSIYGIFGQQLGKFKYQGGIRLEQAYQIPNLKSSETRIVNDYFNYFPSAHIRYAFTDKSEISVSYSKRINRSQAADMNPFTNYSDPYNLRKGNPYLKPEYIDSYDLGYTNEIKKVTLTASMYYRHTTGVITRFKEYYTDNTSAVTFTNLDESHAIGSELIIVYKPFKWWRNTLSGNANYTQYLDNNTAQDWNVSGINWSGKYTASFDFWKKTATVQINAAYNARRITIQGTAQRQGPVDVSFDKSFKGGKISVGARVTDVFNKMGFYMTVDQPTVQQTVEFKWLTRRFFLTFSYKFGKLEMSNKKAGSGEGGFEM